MDTTSQLYHLYYEAISTSLKIEDADLSILIDRYPYSQPLRYALLKRKIQAQEPTDVLHTILYAPDISWLCSYVLPPVEEDGHIAFEEYPQEQVSTEDGSISTDEQNDSEETTVHTPVDELQIGAHDAVEQDVDSEQELDKLVLGGSIAGDYFVFDKQEKGLPEEVSVEEPTQTNNIRTEEEDISLYNDELMPYSFRWWLYKTRLEHADTYQPFATPIWPQPEEGQFDPKKLEEAILDQQIKEHIIHLQDPEMKLSDEAKTKPTAEAEPKRNQEIIEKFIREEPIIQPPSPEQLNSENMARKSAEDNYILVTETLANIYIEQGLYQKAVEVFKKLIYRFPEKKSYFAARIQELEQNL